MIVADLIRVLETCDPNALVLIPRETALGDATERVAAATPIPAESFTSGPAATHGALRLLGLAAAVATNLMAD